MTAIPWIDETEIGFPDSAAALDEPNGLLAVGGDLSVTRLLHAYRHGIFPWNDPSQPILWWTPDPRAILIPDQIHISRSLRKRMSKNPFQLRVDTAFSEVVRNCASIARPGQRGTWISDAMHQAYLALHQAGFAHSIECWRDGVLAGGLYGVSIGRVFFGESMFSRSTDASKIAMIKLAAQLSRWQFALIDCQVSNPHLTSLGASTMPRAEFETLLQQHCRQTAPDWRRFGCE